MHKYKSEQTESPKDGPVIFQNQTWPSFCLWFN